MLYIIGIGLGDPTDITVKGLSIVKKASRVYLENYTSLLSVGQSQLERFYEREIILADRDLVEQGADEIFEDAIDNDVVLLVIGDPFSATTHTDIVLRAKQLSIPTKVIHNASIMNAIGCTGLQLYSFGETVSIPYWTSTWQPDSFFDKICANKRRGLHTLCLLDIKVKEPTPESLTKKKKEYLPPLFMPANVAAKQILEIIKSKPEDDILPVTEETKVVGVARVGSESQEIVYCTLSEMLDKDLGPPLHSLVIVGNLHPVEEEFLIYFAV